MAVPKSLIRKEKKSKEDEQTTAELSSAHRRKLESKMSASTQYGYPISKMYAVNQARVVQKLDNAIHRVNHYPADSVVCFVNIYPLDSDLSGG